VERFFFLSLDSICKNKGKKKVNLTIRTQLIAGIAEVTFSRK